MTAPITPQRRNEIEAMRDAHEGTRPWVAAGLADLLAEIDRLNADIDALVEIDRLQAAASSPASAPCPSCGYTVGGGWATVNSPPDDLAVYVESVKRR